MPTEAQFRAAADGMRDAAAAAHGVRSSIAQTRDYTGMTGGSNVQTAIVNGLDAGAYNAAALAERCASLATVLDGRADVCRAYWDSVGAWSSQYSQWLVSSSLDPTLPEPQRPTKPQYWVE